MGMMSDLGETPARLCPSGSRCPSLLRSLICAGLGSVLFAVLLLVACADDLPTEPDGVPASVTAAATVEVALPLTDREVLEVLFAATGGEAWTDNTNWLTDEPLSEWYGVRLRYERVHGLSLRDNNLKGGIPAEIGGLDSLFNLHVGGNELAGLIPPELGKLKGVRYLSLDRNEFEGALPPEMGGMEALEQLSLSNTDLSGTVPTTFANLGLNRFYFVQTDLCFPPLAATMAGLDSGQGRAVYLHHSTCRRSPFADIRGTRRHRYALRRDHSRPWIKSLFEGSL